jgi:phospholipase C
MPKTALCHSICALAALCLLSIVPAHLLAQPDHDDAPTTTPIKHIVIIFQENVSFDHYFGTYPFAANPPGEPAFHSKDDTPRVNNLVSSGLLTNNPNGVNPFRIDRSVPNTCDQDHNYGDEQKAFHGGLMDNFLFDSCKDAVLGTISTMGYYDGNTVTALWDYAQHFAMSDNSFGTTFGPSTPGLLNLVAGNTFEATITNGPSGSGNIAGGASVGSVVGDPDPKDDMCSNPKRTQITMSGQNIGDLLTLAGITWGSFMGGFANCAAETTGLTGLHSALDYIPHHAFFEYWKSTSNPNHLPPSSVAKIGTNQDQANHQYDISAFTAALNAHNLPAVSFIKAPAYEDGHAGYSDPLDEQFFLVNFINMLEKSEEWNETAVFIAYDDSDGWYDHQMGPINMQSNVSDTTTPNDADQLLGPGNCGKAKPAPGTTVIQNGRCGLGPRLPLLLVSPWANRNYVDHRVTDQSSIIHFIEDNWLAGQRIGNGSTDAESGTVNGMFDFDDGPRAGKLFLDPFTGQALAGSDDDHDGR